MHKNMKYIPQKLSDSENLPVLMSPISQLQTLQLMTSHN